MIDALVRRAEIATGPDRELDQDTHHFLGLCTRDHDGICDDYKAPRYTESIDAALTLAPAGWTRAVDATVPDMGVRVDLYKPGPVTLSVCADHRSEAIATYIAALRARSIA